MVELTDASPEHPEPLVELNGISKSFPGVRALRDAALSIAPGEVHGLVGENGAGKSTIIKTIAGIYSPERGTISADGQIEHAFTPARAHELGIRFVHQELQLVPHFTVTEAVFLGNELRGPFGVRSRAMRAKAESTLRDVLGVTLDGRTLVRDLGPAMQKLVQIARALVDDGARLIVFDEPTAPLAADDVERVLEVVRRLRDRGIAVLYISHYLGEIAEICDRVTIFRNGTQVTTLSDLSAESVATIIPLMVGRELTELFSPRDRPALASPSAPLLVAEEVQIGDRATALSFEVRSGEILGVAGLLGSGTQELVDGLIGLHPVKRGTLLLGGTAVAVTSPAVALEHGVVLIPRDRRHDGLVLDMSVSENINLATLEETARWGFRSKKRADARAQGFVSLLDIRPPGVDRASRLLSGGNQQKVVLARSLAAHAKVLIFDDPTVGVDIGAKAEIYRHISELAQQGVGILVASSDPSELLGLCDRIIVLVRGELVQNRRADAFTRDGLVAAMTESAPAGQVPA